MADTFISNCISIVRLDAGSGRWTSRREAWPLRGLTSHCHCQVTSGKDAHTDLPLLPSSIIWYWRYYPRLRNCPWRQVSVA